MLRHTARPDPAAYIGDIGTVLLGGVLAHFVWEIWANVIAPSTFLGRTITVDHIIGPAFGLGQFINTLFLQGFLSIAVYPITYYYFFQPMVLAMGANWAVAAIMFGGFLWILTTFFFAHVLAGYAAFFSFNDYSMGILLGSIFYSLALAGVIRAKGGD